MSGATRRPARLLLVLAGVVLLAGGVAAWLVNVPLVWIAAAEGLALGGIAARLTRSRQAQALPKAQPDVEGTAQPPQP